MPEQLSFSLTNLYSDLSLNIEEEVEIFALTLQAEVNSMRRAGMADKSIYNSLLKDARENGRVFGQFNNKVKDVLYAGVQGASAIGERALYQSEGVNLERWVWVTTVSPTGPCPDCAANEGMELSYNDWIDIGLPGSGWSVCKGACLCELRPAGLSGESKIIL